MRNRCWFTGRTIPLWLLAIVGVVCGVVGAILSLTLVLRALAIMEGTAMVCMAWLLFKEFALRKG